MLVTLQDEGRSTTTRHQSVSVLVKRTTGLRGIIVLLAQGKRLDTVKRCHTIHVGLLTTTTDHTVLQTVLDQQGGETYSLRTRGTGGRSRQVDTLQVEQTGEVHRDGRVHRLEDGTTATGSRTLKLSELIQGNHRGLGHRVITIDDTYLVLVDIVQIQLRILQRIFRCHIGILRFLRHKLPEIAVHKRLQVSLGHISTEG